MTVLTRRALTASSFAFFIAGCASQSTSAPAPTPSASPAPRPRFGTFGVELSNRDLTVKPGDDFNRYCNGHWFATTQIPPDRTSWGSGSILSDQVIHDVRELIEATAASGGAPGSNEQKIADFYKSFMDTNAINARGLQPVQADLARIAAIRTQGDAWALACAPDFSANFPISMYPSLDARDPDKYCITLTQAGLGMPDRDYYLRTDQQFPQLRDQYKAHIARQLTNAGQTDAERKASAILALETEIARRHWAVERRRDVVATYNKKTRAEVIALNSRFPWMAGLTSAGVGNLETYVVAELDTMRPLSQLVLATPVDAWKAYLTFHYIHAAAPVLPTAIDDENFAFFGHTLNGQPQQRERWKRAISAIDGSLGEAAGKLYVDRHFPASSKAQMQQLVENMRRAYGARVDQLSWMSAETKIAAHEKLRTFRPKIGYPDRWRDYSAYDVRPNDAFGNAKRSSAYEWNRQIERINQPTDRDEWGITTFTVDAYYNPTWNEIVFPAAILQPPFFDPAADPAVIYGGIGAIIGHEMGHGFDDQGARQDARGVLRDWWNAEDVRRFSALGDKLVAQYNAYSPLPGIHVNGRLTLGENIGDLGGLQVAREAYLLSLNGQPAPVIEGFSGDQRFYLGYGQIWKRLSRDEALRNLVLSDPHSPPQYRVNGVVRNHDAWYAAFTVQPGDALYLAPADRVLIW
ncbi:MAG: M13 family metallopeptidase [Vitreimonas sp.]